MVISLHFVVEILLTDWARSANGSLRFGWQRFDAVLLAKNGFNIFLFQMYVCIYMICFVIRYSFVSNSGQLNFI